LRRFWGILGTPTGMSIIIFMPSNSITNNIGGRFTIVLVERDVIDIAIL